MRFMILALLLAGCTTNSPLHYGNYLNPSAVAYNKEIAEDSVKKLVALYPPATTRIDIKQATADDFGGKLVELLRVKGYAILEYNPATDAQSKNSANSPIDLKYIVDQVPSMSIYRATLLINEQPLSRVYTAHNGILQPAGAWARKE